MNRKGFLKGIVGLSLFSLWGCQPDGNDSKFVSSSEEEAMDRQGSGKILRKELKEAWLRSETLTMANIKQMPPEFFTFKYTEEAMTFSEQWRHVVKNTCGQLSSRTGIDNPYKDIKLPVQMTKEHIIEEMEKMYTYVQQSIQEISDEILFSTSDFAGDTIPLWRFFYAMENHIIHHRGQCIVYLRLKGVVPKGFYGW